MLRADRLGLQQLLQLLLLLLLLLPLTPRCRGSSWLEIRDADGDRGDSNDEGDILAFDSEEPEQRRSLPPSPSQPPADDDNDDDDAQLTAELRLMRDAILQELERRAVQGKSPAPQGLAAVYDGAKKVGKVIDADNRKKKKKKKQQQKQQPKTLWQRMLRVLPAPVWISLLLPVTLLLLLLLLGLGFVCYRLCCAKRAKRKVRGEPQTLLHKDLFYGEKPPYGILYYSLEYDLKYSFLLITVNNCVDLPSGIDMIDPYVVVKIDDEKESKERSKVMKNNCNPVFNFVRKVKIKDKKLLKSKVIVFEVYDWDISTHHRMIARGVLKLSNFGQKLDSILGRPMFDSIKLRKGLDIFCRGVGDICVSFSFSQSRKLLTVTVVEGKAVFVMKRNQNPDMETLPNTYVQVILHQLNPNKLVTRRSDIVKQSRNPYFNFKCTFNIKEIEKLKTASIIVELYHRTETLRIKRQIGYIELSANAEPGSLPALHWQEVFLSSGSAVAKWHSLVAGSSQHLRSDKHSDKDSDHGSSDSKNLM